MGLATAYNGPIIYEGETVLQIKPLNEDFRRYYMVAPT